MALFAFQSQFVAVHPQLWKTFAICAYQNVFLELKRVLVWKEMLVDSEYPKYVVGILLWDKDIV
jgi:hypothetical protein